MPYKLVPQHPSLELPTVPSDCAIAFSSSGRSGRYAEFREPRRAGHCGRQPHIYDADLGAYHEGTLDCSEIPIEKRGPLMVLSLGGWIAILFLYL